MNWEVMTPLIIFLIIVFILGFWGGKYINVSDSFIHEYFIGGRRIGGFVLAMTMVATYGSGSSFIGGPGVAYNEGLGWVLLSMIQLATGYFVLMVIGKKFAIIARKYNAVTLVDYLKERYKSKWVVILSAASIVIFLFSSMAAQWVGGGRLIESLTGLPYGTALFIFAVSALIYVIFGGFRAVALADTVQGIVMFFGTLILLIGTVKAGGGVANIMGELAAENPRLITPFGHDGGLSALYVSTFWILIGIGVVGLPQIAVRGMSYRSSKAMHRAIIIGTVVIGFIMLGMHLIGVFARVVMPGVEVGDKVMPLLTMEVLPPWLAGVVLAAPLAAIMSTVNALLLLVSSSIVKDIYLNYIHPEAENRKIKNISLSVTAIIGILVYFMALEPPEFLIWLNLFSFGGLEATFIWPIVLGLYWKAGNKYGAIASMIIGIGSYILLDRFYPNPFGMHTVVLPVLFSFIAFVVGSLMTQNRIQHAEA